MTVEHVGQRPLMALRPFFITSSTPAVISLFDLHLTQYPSAMSNFCHVATHDAAVMCETLRVGETRVNAEFSHR
jgi:hypothetical protein